ncbi:MAG: imidazoleglycerol-phosphate dehydratase HisB, partial [Gammaproteobacteria bacterium]|nr:imidazoleglycerol-phosphate dehydratase HisB [Gammaproteobacteria bacterium]
STFPLEQYQLAQTFILDLFRSQGISFADVQICPHRPEDHCDCRKPKTGLVQSYLDQPGFDRQRSAVIGDRATDAGLASNMGIASFMIDGDDSWERIVRTLVYPPRTAIVSRRTRETCIDVFVDLDTTPITDIETGIGFFDHMLEQIAVHGDFALRLRCDGDLEVDEHHTVEDSALTLGAALREALGDKRDIGRYGFTLPMDESLAQVAIDLSGRPWLEFDGQFTREQVGALPTELVPHFFRSLAEALGAAIHIRLTGENNHHMIEAAFKGVGRCLRQALARDGTGIPSSKGTL